MKISKKLIIAIIGILLIVLVLAVAFISGGKDKSDNSSGKNAKETITETATEAEKETKEEKSEISAEKKDETKTEVADETLKQPTFMYFVTNSDLKDAKTKEMLEKLQAEYKEKVTFEIKNVDEDKKLLENFSIVDGNTPTLIMLNAESDISNILFKTNDFDVLKNAIDAVMNN